MCVRVCPHARPWTQGRVCEDNYFHQLLASLRPTAPPCRTDGLGAFNSGSEAGRIPPWRLPPWERRSLSPGTGARSRVSRSPPPPPAGEHSRAARFTAPRSRDPRGAGREGRLGLVRRGLPVNGGGGRCLPRSRPAACAVWAAGRPRGSGFVLPATSGAPGAREAAAPIDSSPQSACQCAPDGSSRRRREAAGGWRAPRPRAPSSARPRGAEHRPRRTPPRRPHTCRSFPPRRPRPDPLPRGEVKGRCHPPGGPHFRPPPTSGARG